MVSVVVFVDFVKTNYPPITTLVLPEATQPRADQFIFVENRLAVSEHTVSVTVRLLYTAG